VILLIVILVVWALVWFVFIVPSRRKRSAHAAMQDSVGVGDEIITAGGLHAEVREVDDDTLRVELAPGFVVTLDRRAVAAVAREIELEAEDEEDDALEDEAAAARGEDESAA
jgi:preprotein translocase subunit YajC